MRWAERYPSGTQGIQNEIGVSGTLGRTTVISPAWADVNPYSSPSVKHYSYNSKGTHPTTTVLPVSPIGARACPNMVVWLRRWEKRAGHTDSLSGVDAVVRFCHLPLS